VAVRELDPKRGVRQHFRDLSFQLYRFFLSHVGEAGDPGLVRAQEV
jgi:hypothetical protein